MVSTRRTWFRDYLRHVVSGVAAGNDTSALALAIVGDVGTDRAACDRRTGSTHGNGNPDSPSDRHAATVNIHTHSLLTGDPRRVAVLDAYLDVDPADHPDRYADPGLRPGTAGGDVSDVSAGDTAALIAAMQVELVQLRQAVVSMGRVLPPLSKLVSGQQTQIESLDKFRRTHVSEWHLGVKG